MKIYLISFMLLMLCLPNSSYAKRYALVIGNSNYGRDLGNLDNPVNDATDMAALLKRKKFNVIKLTNATKRQMSKGISRFTKQLQEEHAVGLFFFAGHGVEVDGRNYLIPIKANIDSEADVEFESVNASRVMRNMEKAGNNLNMIILDACRNNPYARSFRSASRGLAEVNPPKGSLILYATSPGDVASDGSGRNGLFTQHLLKAINTPNLKVEDVFKRTANKVYNDTARKQLPWQSGVMLGDFYFSGQQAIKKTVAAIGVANNHQQAEISFWNSIADETNAAYFQSYITKYPQGEYIDLALLKLEEYRIPQEVLKQSPQLTIKTSPENARIRLLNIAPKYRQGMQLKAGRYHLEVTKTGYQRYTKWFNLDNQHQSLYVELIANATAPVIRKPVQPIIKPKSITRDLGVVTDPKTNLMWMRCSLGQAWTGSTCQGNASKYTFQGALNKARGFSYAGYSDWRVPTRAELHNLVWCSSGHWADFNKNKWSSGGCLGNYQHPTINQSLFPNTPKDWFWSSSPFANNSGFAWAVYFGNGIVSSNIRTNDFNVRLVR